MFIRNAIEDDAADLRWVARASLQVAYDEKVSETAIDTAVANWYSDETLPERLANPRVHIKIAEADGQVLGLVDFTASEDTEEGVIQWIHVDPEHWGEGIGDALFEEAESSLFAMGVSRIEGRAVSENRDIIECYEKHGYREGMDRETTIGDETFTERSYLKFADEETPRLVESRETEAGRFYIALDEHKVGSKGDFYVAYRDEDREAKYGFYCDNCSSVNASMDSMGRVTCNECDSTAKPTRWDAAYL